MHIIELKAENIKRIKAVRVRPSGNLVVVGGRNAQGKTSVLDAIEMALGGAARLPKKPVHTGADKGVTELDLGDYTIRRAVTAAGGTTLTVKAKDGSPIKSPQALLDTMMGPGLGFDPLAFAREKNEAKQQDMLRRIVKLDTSAIDNERAKVFDDRTGVGRELKSLEARWQARGGQHPDWKPGLEPPAEVNIADLVSALAQADKRHEEHTRLRSNGEKIAAEWRAARAHVEAQEKEIARLREEIAKCEREIDAAKPKIADLRAKVLDAKDKLDRSAADLPDRDVMRQELASAESVNANARGWREMNELFREVQLTRENYAKHTDAIEALDRRKAEMVAGVTYPVAGLGFAEDGSITFNGEPFSQASAAEKLRVSVAIGAALNPLLKVMLIREGGNDLDSNGMKLLGELAAAHGAQVWIERVAESKDGVTVLIEDGEVAGEVRTAPPTAASASALSGAARGGAGAVTSRTYCNTSTTHDAFVDMKDGSRILLKPGEELPLPSGEVTAHSRYVEVTA